MSKNGLTSRYFYAIISKFVTTSAAIAQPVERILGKDEVASSNLASSSKKEPRPSGLGSFFAAPDLNHLNASVRWPLARSQLDGIDSLIFAPPTQGQKCKQIWLAAPPSFWRGLLFFQSAVGGDRVHRLLRFCLFVSSFLHDPFPGIILNVFPNFIVIPLITDHVVIIGSLEDNRPNLPIAKPLEGRNKVRNCHISRGRRPRRPNG